MKKSDNFADKHRPEYVRRKDKIRLELSKTHYLTYDYAWTFENWRLRTVQ